MECQDTLCGRTIRYLDQQRYFCYRHQAILVRLASEKRLPVKVEQKVYSRG